MKQILRGELQNMAEADILAMINPDTIERIRKTDPHPVFKAYCVGHEGEARPNMIGVGTMVFQYLRDAVVKLHDKIRQGIKAFRNHATTNEHQGRTTIGEVVGKSIREIGGKLASVAAIYLYPEHKNDVLDVASIETEVEYSLDDRGIARVETFNDVTGIALGDSRVAVPAFPGATLLASMQAFQTSRGKSTHERGAAMTREEIIAAIKEGNLTIGDLFADQDILSARVVKRELDKAEQTGYEHHRQKMERKFGEDPEKVINGLQDQVKTLKTEKSTLESQTILSKVSDVLKAVSTERKIDEKRQAFIGRNLKTFKSEAKDDAALRVDVNKFLDEQLREFDESMKVLGIDPATITGSAPAAAAGQRQEGKGLPGSEQTAGQAEQEQAAVEAEDPSKNDLIPKTEAAK